MKNHPSPLGHGWQLQNGLCRQGRHMCPALPDFTFGIQTESTAEILSSDDDSSEFEMSSDSKED